MTFSKYDHLQMTIFNAIISNIGANSHRELEDYLEQFNSGMTSQLGRAFNTNLIKLGIFLESQHLNMFSLYGASNVQSKYYAAHSLGGEWYDRLNSTIDYDILYSVSNYEEPRYATKILGLGDIDAYVADVIWIGTDNDIYQYNISNDSIAFVKVIRPGDSLYPVYINDMIIINGIVYVVGTVKDTAYSYIYYSSDYGVNWATMGTFNLPSSFENFTIINNTKVVGSGEGLFYCDNNFDTWYPCNIVLSSKLGTDDTILKSRISNFGNTTFIIAESNGYFGTSGSGIEFFCPGKATSNDITVINYVLRYRNLTWIGTDKGLYNDGNSILSDTVQFGLQNIENSLADSVVIPINCVISGGDAVFCCSSTGNLYRLLDSVWTKYKVPDFDHADKLYYSYGEKNYILITSYNKMQVLDVTVGEGIFG